jgi:hypothetical protein
MNSSRKFTSGAKSVGVDVVVENPRPVFEVAEEAFNGAPQPKGLVHVVLEPRSNHGFTVPGAPIREQGLRDTLFSVY